MTTGEEDSFEIDREKIETVTSFTFLGSVIEREGKCDMEIKRRVAIGKTVMNGMNLAELRDATVERRKWRSLIMTVARVQGTNSTR